MKWNEHTQLLNLFILNSLKRTWFPGSYSFWKILFKETGRWFQANAIDRRNEERNEKETA